MTLSRRGLLSLSAALACMAQAPATFAQDYPAMPVKLVVPFPPGGPSDDIARILADTMNAAGAFRVIVDNRPGAGGTLAVGQMAKANPDGYSLLFSSLGSLTISPHLRKDLGYDPLRDFAPIAHLASLSPVYAVHPSVPARNAKELADLARARPGTVSLGTSGNGSTVHISIELFKAMTNTNIVHVPYRGAAPALNDALGGQISGIVVDVPAVLSHLKAGKLRAIAVAAPTRSQLLPDVPTMAEQGFADVSTPNWAGVLLPVKTPVAVQRKLAAAVLAAVESPSYRERIVKIGAAPSAMRSSDEFREYLAQEYARWGERISRFGIKAD